MWWLPFAALTLPFLLLFRMTCYYYRKAYYRSFWLSPPACAVAEPHKTYSGETRFPLVMQNAHRYFFYAAVVISLINTLDAINAFHSPDGFGFGLGNIVLLVNVVMLWAYTISCHSCRHIIGGRLKHFSAHPIRYKRLDPGLQAEHEAPGARVDHPRHPRRHRLLRDGRVRGLDRRPALHQLARPALA